MQVKIEKLEKSVVRLEIESGKEIITEALDYSYKKNAKNFKINGFRPGKAPRAVVEKMYGKGVFYDDAINYVISRDYYTAVADNKIEVVAEPHNVEVKEFNDEKAVYVVEVYVKPEVKLGEFKGLEVEKKEAKVSAADVDKFIKMEAEKNARSITVEGRAAEMGDTVKIDFEGTVDGVAFEGGNGKDYNLKLGSGTFIPGFEEQLVGVNPGDEKVVAVTFPAEYGEKSLAGKAAEFKCTVHEITKEEIPEIDDAFAADVSEFETLAEYKKDVKAKMLERKQKEADGEMKEEALKKALANATVEIPECMIKAGQEEEVNRMAQQLQAYGMSLDQYLQYMNATIDEYKEKVKPQAELNVKRDLVLEAIVKAEKIEATEEEIDKEYQEAADYLKKTLEEVKTMYAASRDNVIRDIQLRKASDLITTTYKPVAKTADKEVKADAEKPAKKAAPKKAEGEATEAKKAAPKKAATKKAE